VTCDTVIAVAMIRSGARCDSGIPLSGQVGFLTSVRQAAATSQTLPVPLRCRWNITVTPGRTINVTLYDFGVSTRRHTSPDDRRRSGYDIIKLLLLLLLFF